MAERSVRGEVTAVGEGAPPGCLSDEACVPLTSTSKSDVGGAYWFRVSPDGASQAGESWVFSVAVPGHERPLNVGDRTLVTFSRATGGFSPNVGSFRLSVEDRLEVAVEEGGSLNALHLNDLGLGDVALTRADAVCGEASECGSWSHYDASVKSQGLEHTLSNLGELPLGEWRLVMGGLAQSTSSTGCPDWFVAYAAIAAVRSQEP